MMQSTTESNLEHAADYEEETETSSTESLEAIGDRHEQTDTETTTELSSNEEVTTTVREYDTEKPTDPVTGTPPLKREITQRGARRMQGGKRKPPGRRSTNTGNYPANRAATKPLRRNCRKPAGRARIPTRTPKPASGGG